MNLSKKTLALLLTLMLVLSLTSAAWASPLPLGEVMPNLHEVFVDHDLASTDVHRVMVELYHEPLAVVQHNARLLGMAVDLQHESRLAKAQRDVVTQAKLHGLELRVLRQHTFVFNGLLVEVPLNQVSTLSQLPGVKAVWPDNTVWAEDLSISIPVIRTPRSIGQVDGPDGTGILIAILDTGLDYMHPDLGGGIGPEHKVIGGWDFVDDDDDPMETKNRPGVDAGGRAFNTSHGTHVAHTALAVAPGARLLGIRVLGPTGSGSSADVMAGIEYAVRAGAHVANMSLGAAWGHPDSPWARAVDNAVLAGVVFTVSNGNSGPNDATTGTYAATRLGIAVGWADASPKIMANAPNYSAVGSIMTFSPPFSALFGQELEYVHAGLGRPEDFTNLDVTGRVVLMTRGVISFAAKSRNARDRGAVAAIIYNNAFGNFGGTLGTAEPNDIPTISIAQACGWALRDAPAADRRLTFNMGVHHLMSGSSSRGPTQTMEIRPHVSAPGQNITAAFPFPGTDGSHVPGAFQKEPGGPWYGTISGTSMAAPHVAGAAAILLQANPTWTPEQVRLALMNTANDIRWPHGQSFRPVDQGAGMIDVARAISPNIMINPGAMNFGEVNLGNTAATLTLQGKAKQEITYNVSFARFIDTHDYSIEHAATVVVPAGAEVEFPLTLQVGPDLPASVVNRNDYTGFIIFTNASDATDTYRVPFHFINRQFVSQVSASPLYFSPNGDGVLDTTEITFVVGQRVQGLRIMAVYPGFWRAIFLTTTPLDPGAYKFVWDGRDVTGEHMIGQGSHLLIAQWQIAAGGAWQGELNMSTVTNIAGVYGRVLVDTAAPVLENVGHAIDPANPNHIRVHGNADDFLMTVFQSEGGNVQVNGQPAVIMSQNHPLGGDWVRFESASLPVDVRAGGTFTVLAADSAGNVTEQAYPFTPLTIVNPPTATVAEATHIVAGQTIPGMTITVAGKTVVANAMGLFTTSVNLNVGANAISVVASVPAWAEFAPIVQTIEVHRTGFKLATDKTRVINGEQLVASVVAESVTDLTGVEFVLSYDPTLLEVVSIEPGPAFDGRDLYVLPLEQTAGTVRFAAALTAGQTGFSGSGTVGLVTFRSKVSGVGDISLVSAAGVNSMGLPVTTTVQGQLPIQGMGYGRIFGNVQLPGRLFTVGGAVTPRFQGTTVTWGAYTTTTDDLGNYEILVTADGTHELSISIPGYVKETRTVTLNGYHPTSRQDFVLVSGDINGDGKVTLADLVLLSDAFHARTGQANYLLGADINGDGHIDVFDLFATTRNFTR